MASPPPPALDQGHILEKSDNLYDDGLVSEIGVAIVFLDIVLFILFLVLVVVIFIGK